jgi:Domain of unknown function (DUF4332)
MSYLIGQIAACLLAAFVLGFLLGWLLRHLACRATVARLEARLRERPAKGLPAFPIEDIEGIGPGFGRRLREAGITDTATLLTRCLQADGRASVGRAAGDLDEGTVRNWATMADLMRIPGVGGQWSELLWRAGVRNVQALGKSDPATLLQTMTDVNAREHRVHELPGQERLARWVKDAGKTDPVLPADW